MACPRRKVRAKKHHAYVFIEEMRNGINFQPIVASTAMVLYHRFYHYQSMRQFKWKEMAWCCLFAAFKIEEKVLKMESLLKWSHFVSCKLTKMSREDMERNKLDVRGQQYFEMKERLQFNERVLLQTIGFDMDIKQTGFMIITLIKTLKQKSPVYTSQWTKTIAKVAFEWSVCSAGTELCLVHKPEVIAMAFVYGAAHDIFGKLEHPSRDMKIWDLWDALPHGAVNERLLHGIMTEFHTYCQHFKEPRAYWRASSAASGRNAAGSKDRKTETVAPPQDPARYHPDAKTRDSPSIAAAAVAAKAMVAKPSSGTAAASGPPSASPGSMGAPVSVAAPASALAGSGLAVPSSGKAPMAVAAAVPALVTSSPSRTVSASAAGSAQPTPPRTADNTPHSSPAAISPGPPPATTTEVTMAVSSMVVERVENGRMTASAELATTVVRSTSSGHAPASAPSHTADQSSIAPSRPSKRPLAVENFPPGGGDGSMNGGDLAWQPEVSAAKRLRPEEA
mmetsp:Transcript_19340/g.57472  ORF Transcript_19340/g.57472 Transcript_19340/m.57472 type:complete len:507 (+) Transcript_19340:707-2227(+)